jgi:hypothetical protein
VLPRAQDVDQAECAGDRSRVEGDRRTDGIEPRSDFPHTSVDPTDARKHVRKGNALAVKVNGNLTVECRDDTAQGYSYDHIVLGRYGPETLVDFRKVSIRELSPP